MRIQTNILVSWKRLKGSDPHPRVVWTDLDLEGDLIALAAEEPDAFIQKPVVVKEHRGEKEEINKLKLQVF